jgi:ubiquitin-conjugating enzyme E2 J2
MASAAASRRLRREALDLQTNPVAGVLALPIESNILDWRFVLRGACETPYEGGYYYGKIKFPHEYPMKPPSLLMLTPSGRFEPNTRICMSMSDFHPESWNPGWGVGTILVGLLSFMSSEEITTGSIKTTETEKKACAVHSHDFNSNEKLCCELFAESQAGLTALYEAAEARIVVNSAKLAKLEHAKQEKKQNSKPAKKAVHSATTAPQAEPSSKTSTSELRAMNVSGLRQLAMSLEVTLSPKEFTDKRAIVRKLLSSGKLEGTEEEATGTAATSESESQKQAESDAVMLALLAEEGDGLASEGAGSKRKKKKKKKKKKPKEKNKNKQEGSGDFADGVGNGREQGDGEGASQEGALGAASGSESDATA